MPPIHIYKETGVPVSIVTIRFVPFHPSLFFWIYAHYVKPRPHGLPLPTQNSRQNPIDRINEKPLGGVGVEPLGAGGSPLESLRGFGGSLLKKTRNITTQPD